MAVRVLEETGLLPHLNPGVMSWEELARLKPVAPSMGMMLETTAARLHAEPGGPHFGSPDKDPEVRLRVLHDAGRLSIPFTTGVLIGIGETLEERAEALFAIRDIARRYGSVQEVIVQNFRAKPDTAMRAAADTEAEELAAAVAVARLVLGPGMRLQAPPNLIELTETRLLLRAGIDDWGGVSPVTPDHVNPERPWPDVDALAAATGAEGFRLVERLTVYPPFVRAGQPWIDPRLRAHVESLAGPDGLASPTAVAAGRPWQEPDGGFESSGRTRLHREVDTVGRAQERRADFDEVYGDWDSVEADVAAGGSRQAVPRAPRSGRMRREFTDALRSASTAPSSLTDAQALELFAAAPGAELEALTRLADDVAGTGSGTRSRTW
jgi:FO synthase